MARPSAASSRIEPRLKPEKSEPAISARARRDSTRFRLARSPRRAPPRPARYRRARARQQQRLRCADRSESPSALDRVQARARVRAFRSMPRDDQLERRADPRSFSVRERLARSAARIGASALRRAPAAAARALARRVEAACSAASALSIAPRTRLFDDPSSRVLRQRERSSPPSPHRCRCRRSTMSTRYRRRLAPAVGERLQQRRRARVPEPPSSATAAILLVAVAEREPARTVAADRAPHAPPDANSASDASRPHVERAAPARSRHLARAPPSSPSGRLVLLLVVAGDERAPRLRLDRPVVFHTTLNWPSAFTSPMNTGLCRWWFFSSILIVKPSGALKVWPAIAAITLSVSKSVRLLDGLLPHVDADVGGFHRVVGERLSACPGGSSPWRRPPTS